VADEDNFNNSPELFKDEHSSLPSFMFDKSGFQRQATKSALAESFWRSGNCSVGEMNIRRFVKDGGSLVQ
jgi:hypothetical protein